MSKRSFRAHGEPQRLPERPSRAPWRHWDWPERPFRALVRGNFECSGGIRPSQSGHFELSGGSGAGPSIPLWQHCGKPDQLFQAPSGSGTMKSRTLKQNKHENHEMAKVPRGTQALEHSHKLLVPGISSDCQNWCGKGRNMLLEEVGE